MRTATRWAEVLDRLGIRAVERWGWLELADDVETYAAPLEAVEAACGAVDVAGLDAGTESVADAFEGFHDALSAAAGLVLEFPTLAELFAAAHGMEDGRTWGTGTAALRREASGDVVAVGEDPTDATACDLFTFGDGSGVVVVGDTWDLHPGGSYAVRALEDLDALADRLAPPGFRVSRGSMFRTSDDDAGRWYWQRDDVDVIDRRGRGFATLGEALDAADQALAEDLPAMLRAWRDREGLTQAQAARLLGVALRSVHGWEAGQEPVSARLVAYALKGMEAEA